MRTRGVSPKVIADLAVSVIAFLITAGVLDLDAPAAAALSKVLGSMAAIAVSPGDVTVHADDIGGPFRGDG